MTEDRDKRNGSVIIVDNGINEEVVSILRNRLNHEIELIPVEEMPQSYVSLTEPISITQLKIPISRPKLNCKKGHNYELVEEKKEGALIKQRWQCRCGKVL